jgi:hypothetical protein
MPSKVKYVKRKPSSIRFQEKGSKSCNLKGGLPPLTIHGAVLGDERDLLLVERVVDHQSSPPGVSLVWRGRGRVRGNGHGWRTLLQVRGCGQWRQSEAGARPGDAHEGTKRAQ